jgi:hypothetical protein
MVFSQVLQLLARYDAHRTTLKVRLLALPANNRLRREVTYSDKDSNLFQYVVNYGCKRFNNTGPRGIIFQNCSLIFKKILFQSKIAKSLKNGANTFRQLDISST